MSARMAIIFAGTAVAAFFAGADGVRAQEAPAFEPLRVTIQKTNGDDTVGFILKASEKAILWKYTPESPGNNTMARADIKTIEFDKPEQWAIAAANYAGGNFAEAEKGFAGIADFYKDIMLLEGNPASEARYYHVESLRRQGKFEEMEKALDEETLTLLKASLPEGFLFQLNLNTVWAAAAAEKWEIVDQLVTEHSLESEGGRPPEFKMLPPSQLVQLAFLRALSSQAKGEKELAVEDYYRVLTLGYGNDRALSSQAAIKTLAVLKEDPQLSETESKLKEIHGLAMIYKNSFGGGEIPSEYSEYAKPWVDPDAPAAPEEETPAASESGDAAPVEGDTKAEAAAHEEAEAPAPKAE